MRPRILIKVWHLVIEPLEINTKNKTKQTKCLLENARGCLAQLSTAIFSSQYCACITAHSLFSSALQFHKLSIPENPVWLLYIKDSPWKKNNSFLWCHKGKSPKPAASELGRSFQIFQQTFFYCIYCNLMHFLIHCQHLHLSAQCPGNGWRCTVLFYLIVTDRSLTLQKLWTTSSGLTFSYT